MTKEEKLKAIRVKLYKATPLKLDLVDELISAIKNCFHGVETNGIRFDSTFKVGDNYVKSLELDELSGVLVYWDSDHYCSAYVLEPREIRRIIDKMKAIKDYYISKCK